MEQDLIQKRLPVIPDNQLGRGIQSKSILGGGFFFAPKMESTNIKKNSELIQVPDQYTTNV